ncbi:DUF5687 family protein [Croceitalea rosinachiae]|uniref:DUF5687 family protein n=1 Tax=Croceitalea rosinachiae TaxID=3075596 RepID=A0ABU3A7R6_9FLAO|nr:DUF5687 family protein [Croceitalea sp. F388]MDT0606217.1 DUF5687 family protein [Croceitalea sp. F388]
MFKRFIDLQWKSFFRSSSLGKSLGIKIFMGFMMVYLLVSLGGLGAALYFILRKLVPDEGPIWVVSQYLIFWFLAELLFRFFMQKLPVMDVKPLLINNIKKSKIVNYVLGRSMFSGYNLLSLMLFFPFTIVLTFKGYPALNVWVWFLAIMVLVLCINYINFIINKSDKAFTIIAATTILLYALDYFGILGVKAIFAPIFHALYAYPITILAPITLLFAGYVINYKYLEKALYLDHALKSKSKSVETSEMAWTKRFGALAPFLQLDLKLIWRNKRTKAQVFISLLMVFYGLIFYTQEIYANMVFMHAFLGIFMTGIFLSNFGQFIPAWDSAYYGMMMSQNIPLRQYLESKVLLITVSVVVMFFLTIPYVYFGWNILALNTACAIYNLGVNIPVILYFGSFNKKRIELDQSAFGNMQGTSATQFLIMVPVLIAPIVLFGLLDFLIGFHVAVAVTIALGVIGLVFRNKLMDKVAEQYAKKKYGMLAGFKEKNN